MFVLNFHRWAYKGTLRWVWRRVYVAGRWTPLCHVRRRSY